VALLVDLVRFGGWRVDAVLSAELAASYKPDAAVYLRGARLLGCAPEEVGMVAAHAGDLSAAAQVGLRPLFVRRPDEWGTGAPEDPPDLVGLVVADSLLDLAAQLGC
jgi:2-haloacid dehalogenase